MVLAVRVNEIVFPRLIGAESKIQMLLHVSCQLHTASRTAFRAISRTGTSPCRKRLLNPAGGAAVFHSPLSVGVAVDLL